MSVHQLNPEQTKWWGLGACRGLDATIFYPDEEVDAGTAKSICAQCRVQTECLEFALTNREKAGVWGGATERERRRIVRQRRKTPDRP